ncbi:MOS1T transposase, partial [Acromyrmex heyeri]
MEQRAVIKFNAKLGKSASETFRSMQQVYGSQCLGRTAVFEWHKRFLEGRETLEDDKKSGRPILVRTSEMIEKVVMTEWVPEGQTVTKSNQTYYLTVLATLRERVRKKRSELWKNKSWILHQDNAPAYNALSVKRYLAARGTPVLEHAPYSPDLAPCDFFLFPKIKSALKGTRFESMEEVKRKSAELLNALTKEDFQHCFDQWKKRMERCVARGGEYIEGQHSIVE